MANNHLITEILKEGKIILYPTDTVWGLGCDATNPEAVAKIFQIKQRSESKSLIILVSDIQMLQQYVTAVPSKVLAYLQTLQEPTTISGEPTPLYYQLIDPKIIAQCDYVVPYRQDDTQIKNPSRLIRFDADGEILILR